MAQRSRTLAAVLERGLFHHRRGLDPRSVAHGRLSAPGHLVRQRPADHRPLAVPAGRGALHRGAPVPRLVPDLRRLDGHAAVAGRAGVVEGHAAGQLAAGGAADAARQRAAAAPWQVVERGRRAVALRVAAARAVLPGQAVDGAGAGHADRPHGLPRRDHPGFAGGRDDGDHADRAVDDRHRALPPREAHGPAGRPRSADRAVQPPRPGSARAAPAGGRLQRAAGARCC